MLLGLGSPHAPRVPQAGCLRYEPDTVSITGRLARHVFYGAPGYGEDPKRDELEPGFYLDLPRPVCAVQAESPNDRRSGVRRIQLLLDSAGYARLRPSLGRVMTLRGTLSGSITGHHHALLLLDVLKPRSGGHL